MLTSSVLMPRELVEQAMLFVGLRSRIEVLNPEWRQADYNRFCDMCILLGVSKQALIIRLKRLGLLGEEHMRRPNETMNIYMEDDEDD